MLSSMDDMAAVLVGVVIAVEHSLDRVFSCLVILPYDLPHAGLPSFVMLFL